MRLMATRLPYSMVDHNLFMGKLLVFLELCAFISNYDIVLKNHARFLIGQKPMFYQSIEHRKSVF